MGKINLRQLKIILFYDVPGNNRITFNWFWSFKIQGSLSRGEGRLLQTTSLPRKSGEYKFGKQVRSESRGKTSVANKSGQKIGGRQVWHTSLVRKSGKTSLAYKSGQKVGGTQVWLTDLGKKSSKSQHIFKKYGWSFVCDSFVFSFDENSRILNY